MKKLLAAILGLVALNLGSQAGAVPSLSLLPANQIASSGDNISLDLVIDGLGDFAPDSLGDFDVDIGYDTSALTFLSYSMGSLLGDLSLVEALDYSGGDLGGTVNIAELSLLDADPTSGPSFFGPYLDDIQPGSFTLATLDFHVDALAAGTSTIVSIDSVNALGDGYGNPLSYTTNNALIVAPGAAVPEPAMLPLMCLGLVGLLVIRRSNMRIN